MHVNTFAIKTKFPELCFASGLILSTFFFTTEREKNSSEEVSPLQMQLNFVCKTYKMFATISSFGACPSESFLINIVVNPVTWPRYGVSIKYLDNGHVLLSKTDTICCTEEEVLL